MVQIEQRPCGAISDGRFENPACDLKINANVRDSCATRRLSRHSRISKPFGNVCMCGVMKNRPVVDFNHTDLYSVSNRSHATIPADRFQFQLRVRMVIYYLLI